MTSEGTALSPGRRATIFSEFEVTMFGHGPFGFTPFGGVSTWSVGPIMPPEQPSLFLQAVVIPASTTDEGQLIEAVAIPWFEIVELLRKDPNAVAQIDWRKWEEIIAGGYTRAGFDEVVLTPRAGDQGRDVIATKRGIGSVRFFDQVKAYNPGRRVDANDVRAMIGVLNIEPNVSKGIITTTADFAPGVYDDENIRRFMPHRLELKPRDALIAWLNSLGHSDASRKL